MQRGKHLLIDCQGVSRDVCLDDRGMLRAMAVAAERAGATVVSQVRYHFGHNSPPGFTAVVLLDESHCTAHTYADLGLIALDVFTCGSTEPRDVLAYLREEVDLGEVTIREVGRFPLEPGMEGHGAVLAAVANELAVATPGDGPRLA
ncbi:MAG: adenosylmethionine decarboxylase [Deltaproteobacteria bacterium]|nr:adenosylmethionine decarboxylase [Deltaproteobacteria bacterium]NCP96479.1 adenosylmethionine decarboxylase [Deltaproteobacteria bacterium]NCS73145.1 adenosylmethionine decarboxylase [Deltaproteobacteria bacterium]